MIFTIEQMQFISEAQGVSLYRAKETLQKEMTAKAESLFGEDVPKDKNTEKYIAGNAKMYSEVFLKDLNKALHSFAGAVIAKPKKATV